MFKAIDSRSGEEIIILSPEWGERVEELRALDRADTLHCQGCRQPVRVKAGAVRTWHFAHKHLKDCRLGLESPDLLAARAALYARLQRQFGDAVTLEKHLDDARCPRPVDCWVETDTGPIAYWIFDAQARPEAREGIRDALKAARAQVVWLFTAGMLHADEGEEGLVQLSTTERGFLGEAYVDCDLVGTRRVPGHSLCYLDPEKEMLVAYRGLRLVHEPQVYRGRRVGGPLAEVRVHLRTGELAHPFECDQARELRQEQARREEQEEREHQARLAQEREERARQHREERETLDRELEEHPDRQRRAPSPVEKPRQKAPAEDLPVGLSALLGIVIREGVCELCGKHTTDWSTYNGATGTCKCRECMGQKPAWGR